CGGASAACARATYAAADAAAGACRSVTSGSCRSERLRIVVGKKRRHIELAGLQIISAAPVIHHAGLLGLAALDAGLTRQGDEKIAVRRPIDTQPAIVLLSPLQQIRRNVILGVLRDLSPPGPTLQVGPGKIAERLPGRANVALRSEAVQIERRLARAGFLHANHPFEIVGEAKSRCIIRRLRIEQSEGVLATYPELPHKLGTVVVRLLFEVLLDGDRAVQECLGELRIDLITSGRTR